MTLAAAATSSPPIASQEYALLDHAVRLERNLAGRLALYIRLSELNGQDSRELQIETAAQHFEEMVSSIEGQLYRTVAGDIVFVCEEARSEDLDAAVQRLRRMFSDDPIAQQPDDNSETGFCTRYALERDYPQFVALTRRLFDFSEARRQESVGSEDSTAGPAVLVNRDLTPAQLGQLEESLANADLSAIMRQQPICAVTSDHPPEMVFHEMYVSIDELGRTLLPGVSLASDPWLFQHLTRTLDCRVLRHIVHDHAKTSMAFSLNLNVATVLSADFRRFEQTIGQGVRGRLIIEFQHIDIFSDMAAYLFAREYLRELGFKVCIDGLNHLTLPFVDRAKLGLDLLKMHWSDDLLSGMSQDASTTLAGAVRSAGVGRIIMCRCESASALKMGHNMGISLFQGRHIDTLLAPKTPEATA